MPSRADPEIQFKVGTFLFYFILFFCYLRFLLFSNFDIFIYLNFLFLERNYGWALHKIHIYIYIYIHLVIYIFFNLRVGPYPPWS
jgi:hypothetical protein